MVLELGQHHLADGGAAQALGGQRGADFLVADLHHILVTGVGLLHVGPLLDQLGGVTVHFLGTLFGQLQHRGAGAVLAGFLRVVLLQHARGLAQLLHLAHQARLRTHALLVAADGVADLGQVARACWRHDGGLVGAVAHVHGGQAAFLQRQAEFTEADFQRLVQRRHAVVVEARGLGAEHRHLVRLLAKGFAVALHLLGHVAQRIGRTLAVELVDGHELGEVEHVDLLELAGGAVLGRHHVHRHIDEGHDGRIALADAGGLDDHQVEPARLAGGDDVGQGGADLAAGVARGQAAHEDALLPGPWPDGVHADAVAQQRAAGLAAAGVDADDGHAQRVVLVEPQAADQLVRQARLAGAASAGDAQHGCFLRRRGGLDGLHQLGIGLAVLQRGDELRQRAPRGFGLALDGFDLLGCVAGDVLVAAHHHLADHSSQAHALAVLGAVDAAHAVVVQLADLGRHDHAAAAAEHLDVRAAALFQQVDHVLEVFDVAALVAADGDALSVFLQGGGHHVVDAAVVAQVDHFGAHALQDAAHDVDGGVVAVEQRCGGDEAHLVRGAVFGQGLEFCGQVGHGLSPMISIAAGAGGYCTTSPFSRGSSGG